MKKPLLIITALFVLTVAHGQTEKKENTFSFIENSSDTSSLKFIQRISRPGEDLFTIYETIRKQAQVKGANCFKLKKFARDSTGKMLLTLDTYYGNDTFLLNNYNNHEKNTVYIISDGNFNDETYSFNLNGEKQIKSGTYYKYTIKKDGLVKINKGGFTGTTVTVTWQEDNLCKFYTLSGFGLKPKPTQPGADISFSLGRLQSVDTNIGLLIIGILKQKH